jgi:uncharacterized coiled-coil protein SlyX
MNMSARSEQQNAITTNSQPDKTLPHSPTNTQIFDDVSTSQYLMQARDVLYSRSPPPPPPPSTMMASNYQTGAYYYGHREIPPPPPMSPMQYAFHNENPPWVTRLEDRLIKIESHLDEQNRKWKNLESNIQQQNKRIERVEVQVEEIAKVKGEVNSVQIKVFEVAAKVKANSTCFEGMETAMQMLNDQYEEATHCNTRLDNKISALTETLEKLKINYATLKETQCSQNESILDLQCRSMESNLIFYGIDESELKEDEYELTEEVINDFLKSKMNISKNIQFQRVHRLGRKMRDQIKPRPIIAKFNDLKDKDLVKFKAADTLKGSKYGIREQFPKEIEMRRKPLYVEMKKAKDNGDEVKLIRDKLYINRERFLPEEESMVKERNQERYNQTNKTSEIPRSRVFYSRKGRNELNRNTNTPTTYLQHNRFSALEDTADMTEITQSTFAGKRVAMSPLDMEKEPKKNRNDQENRDSNESDESDDESSMNTEIEVVDNSVQTSLEVVQDQTESETTQNVAETDRL